MAEEKLKEVFTIKLDDKEVRLAVQRPNQYHLKEAQKVFNTTFNEALQSGAIVRAKVDSVIREQQLWTDKERKESDELQKKIMEARMQLARGGKVNELKQVAIQIKKDSARLRELNSVRNSLDSNTAEAQAENAKFNCLVSLCTVYDENEKLYFKSYKEFIEKQNDPVAFEAATKLMYFYYKLDPNFENNLPENKFLRQWKFVDEKLRLINKDGHLVDEEGRLINEEGHFVDANENLVDKDGNPVDKDGNYVTGNQQFLDDDGNPVEPPQASPA